MSAYVEKHTIIYTPHDAFRVRPHPDGEGFGDMGAIIEYSGDNGQTWNTNECMCVPTEALQAVGQALLSAAEDAKE